MAMQAIAAVYNQWTGLVDWTTGLIHFHLKCTEMLRNDAQSTTVAISMLGPIFSLHCKGRE